MDKIKFIAVLALLFAIFPQNSQAWWGIKDRLYRAAKDGDAMTIESILRKGYSIDAKDSDGQTALCSASWDYDSYAYDLLLSYGANPNVDCMKTKEEKVYKAGSNYDGYYVAGGLALAVGSAVALANSGGGGGDSPEPGPDPEKDHIFSDDAEFNAYNFRSSGATNFLASINSGKAYNMFYSYDSAGNLTNTLPGTSTVGIIDNGVDGAHNEFSDGFGGSKVSGYNFDYGPCRGIDRKNCWLKEDGEKTGEYIISLYDENEQKTGLSHTMLKKDYDKWEAAYPEDYDWDDYKDRADSFYPIVPEDESLIKEYAHGTHIAGIIAANHNNKGMMGVAFTNTNIKAIRWDELSSLEEPVIKLVDDKVVAINMSFGVDASEVRSSYDYDNPDLKMLAGWKEAADYTISQYETSGSAENTSVYGPIWVKAAGNESYIYPDLESGIKLLDEYSDLQMLVVVSADVTLNSDNTVNTYSLSSFSNHCGNTSGYCIAAPGNYIASTSLDDKYIGLKGTSMATPMVTGAIAFLKNAYPEMSSDTIIALLMNTANKNASDYSESKYGAGLLDLNAAMSYQSPLAGTSSVVTVSGNSLSSASYVRIDNASLTLSAPLAQALQKALPESITAFDAYDRAFDYPTSNYIRASHSGYKQFKNDVSYIIPNRQKQDVWKNNIHFAYASGGTYNKPLNYMLSEYKHGKHTSGFYFSSNSKYQNNGGRHADMNNPFMSFNSAYGITHAYAINPKLSFTTEIAGGENGLYDGDDDYNDTHFKKAAYGFNSGFAYEYKKNLKLGVSGGLLHEDNALLGSNGENAFSFAGGQTYYFGINATWQFMKKWSLSGSWYQGYSKAQSTNSKMLQTSDLVSNGFAADLNYQYDNSLDMGLRLSSPLRIEKGTMSVDFASGRAVEDDTVYRNRYATTLKPQKREYKLAFYGNKEINDDVSLSSEFDIRFNPEHTNASNDYRALLGLSWNF